ncbi:uncharacterized protein PAN0_040c6348 [Moesziomyces antarcticus]|uniref:Uncharacterized protein n=2 Tax=Pseudozyma antarctica TaxID=84753 RepID=A0A081CN69_PSEA2|nr:uncharacterized protein PAN0_040c6348 [Moesziomyces antarcticus]GAK68115.1 conserved hypothetical protein [Moesziomyces antarcticus]SPO45254.1 uncharacterized protein PSANT_02940 [Moesziomyces antarcticus]
MDATTTTTTTTSGAGGGAANSTELMIALSQIQQLIPLLEHRPGGLVHLVSSLLIPLSAEAGAEAMQRYRANVDHAFRVSAELVARTQGGPVGTALELAERLMDDGESKRLLRVRRKRRLFTEQEKLLDGSGPPIPQPRPQAAGSKQDAEAGVLPALPLTSAQQDLAWPTSADAVQQYLRALHGYLEQAFKGKGRDGALKHVKARVASFGQAGFEVEVHVSPILRARIEVTVAESSIDIASLAVGAMTESITSTTPSAFPIFRALSSDVLTHTKRAQRAPAPAHAHAAVWSAYAGVTETIARLILSAAQFQT